MKQLLVVAGEAQVPAAAKRLANPKLGDLARRVLEAVPGEASGRALRDALKTLRGFQLAGIVNALGERRDAAAVPALALLISHMDLPVPPAALTALGKIGTPEAAAVLRKVAPPARHAVVRNDALLRCAARLAAGGDAAGAEAIYREIWSTARPPAWRWAALAGLARLDAAKAVPAIRQGLAAPDPALRALVLRGTLRAADEAPDAAARRALLDAFLASAATPEAKRALLAELAGIPSAGALRLAASFLGDADLGGAAADAMRSGGAALVLQDRATAAAALGAIAEKTTGPAADAAGALRDELLAGVPVVVRSPADRKRSEARKRELIAAAPKGFRVACYLDCGADVADGGRGGPALALAAGDVWVWKGAAPARAGSVFYAGDRVDFEASGLDPKREYRLGFSWWDFDKNGRTQSVWAGGTKLLDRTPLPPGTEKPAERVLPVPAGLCAGGRATFSFRREAKSNAVVSEVWLLESGPARAAAAPAGATAEKPAARAARKAAKRVLIVTGIDYPGHKWKLTTPVLRQALEDDPRLGVTVVEDFNALARPDLKTYDVVVLHFMPWKVEPPSEACREALKAFVSSGKGLVLVHFACGAFPGWDEFVKIAGRAYDKTLRGHDPHGAFEVKIVKPDHPIVKGMASFETVDELYTCLGGDTPIEVLASSTSKVDKKDYAMAFVLTYGKGRVFHSPLGHSVKAFPEPVRMLFRRGTAWAAGLPPEP
jgi:type 1 glutamine amidotransferase